jgi:hypothetical protein
MVVTASLTLTSVAKAERFDTPHLSIESDPISFGWFKTLDDNEMSLYAMAMINAILSADNGDKVEWHSNRAMGYSMVLYTKPTGHGYCRTVYTSVYAFNQEKDKTQVFCYLNDRDRWVTYR